MSALAPRAMLTLAVRLRRVLDLTDPGVRAVWGLAPEDLASNDYARCQEVAVAARKDGYEAIRYPSAAIALTDLAEDGSTPTGARLTHNLAIFADRLHPGSDVRVVRSDILPLLEEP